MTFNVDVEKWFVFPVDNVSDNPKVEWRPDKNQMVKVKLQSKKLGLTKIGNVHSHPVPEDVVVTEELI